MPGWHAATKAYRESGELQVVGVIQEQHPERCRLFAQWKGLDWPILVDSLNLYGLPVIPIAMAVDEAGIVRSLRLGTGDLEGFMKGEAAKGEAEDPVPRDHRDLEKLEAAAAREKTAAAWRELGDGLALWGGASKAGAAIDAYQRAIEQDREDAPSWFRLGVAARSRFDSEQSTPGDFARAAAAWSRALELVPSQYIWRRRIQQYGPRLTKPYNFYGWVDTARSEITARGEVPVALRVPLSVSERSAPSRRGAGPELIESEDPDPEGRIPVDEAALIRVEAAAVPARVAAGSVVRLHVVLEPDPSKSAHWDPEAGPARLWIEVPAGWSPAAVAAVSLDDAKLAPRSRRRFEVEMEVPAGAEPGPVVLSGYVLYPVCEDQDGQCLFLRQEVEVAVQVAPSQGR